ncbi:4Fe-4S binding protein [Olsenella phocaeensis]|uniref:4Fe-4S binding protein n=1 Tax=Olsenella phocaeensis TaxID=1852385 RepID=UPI000931A13B|nr:4Fe-4S binding protein [Olsenella phocaeensis]
MAKRRDKVAVVHCWGGASRYCNYGCVGCGACVAACKVDAIGLNENNTAQVRREACIGCGLCARACPQGIIEIVPREATILPLCSNPDPGSVARKLCDSSCIACGACERACPADAIHVTDNLAVTDVELCIACGMCATKCPRGVIRDANGILAKGF